MTDKELQKLMDDTYNACVHHNRLLKELEEEYEKRFGFNPSSVDDDFFIDTFHYGSGSRITVKQMAKNTRLHS
jgi:hypothetical protein